MLVKFFRGLVKLLSFLRGAIANLLFVAFIALLYVSVSQLQPADIPEEAVLWLEPSGAIVEQYSFNDPLVQLLDPDQIAKETSLSDIVEALTQAASDERIKVVVLAPDKITAIGHSAINSIHRALDTVKAAGKPVLTVSRGMQQHQYLLAAKADEIVLHPMAYIAINGYGAYRDYMKSALDKLRIDVHVFRVGEFKSALEPLMRDSMSNEAKQANQQLLGGLWSHYTSKVAALRGLAPQDIDQYANNYAQLLQEHKGDPAQLAKAQGLVDRLATTEEFWELLEGMYPSFGLPENPAVSLQAYLAATTDIAPPQKQASVALVTVEGAIIDGDAPPGAAAGDSVAKLLWDAKNRDDVKAVVLRVNSGGGSALASEIIRERVLQLQREGKPVVVSMGNVAASGGYWIAANADEIWASPTTITGSIGIFGAIPTADKAFKKLGITNDGVGTTRIADGFNINRALNPQLGAALQAGIEHGYERFISIVSEGRGLERDATLAAAGGRMWSGLDAKNLGLVDYLGEVEDAISSAGKLAGINGQPPVIHMQDQRWAQFTLLQRFTSVVLPNKSVATAEEVVSHWLSTLLPVWLRHPDPSNIYLRCVECAIAE